MNAQLVGTGAIVVAVIAATAVWQRSELQALRREVAELREELRAPAARAAVAHVPAPAPAGGTSAGLPAAELGELRTELAALRASTEEITRFTRAAQAAAALRNSEPAPGAQPIPAAGLRNVGRDTPESAVQTLLWSAFTGETDILAGGLQFTPSARAKADAWFAGLSPRVREEYGSPEKVIALMIARDGAALTSMQVLGQRELSNDEVGVRVRVGGEAGRTKDDTFLMSRARDGWRLTLPDNVVEKFARQLAAK